MKLAKRLRPSPATSIALVALFVSLGGTGYAVSTLPRSSVGNAQLRDRAVTEGKLANSAVVTRKLANGAVTDVKIARNTISAGRIAPNALGGDQIDESKLGAVPRATDASRADLAARATVADSVTRAASSAHADQATAADRAALADHATAADSADRAAVARALERVVYSQLTITIPENVAGSIQVDCDPGLVPVGGGYVQTTDLADLTLVVQSGPSPPFAPDTSGWKLILSDGPTNTGQPALGTGYAICVEADATP